MRNIYILSGLFLVWALPMFSQNQQITNLKLSFNNACASSTFNDFHVQFEWKGNLANADNEFVVELSSPTGDFSSPTHLATKSSRGRDNGNTTQINFQLPQHVAGTSYRVRVRSTSPVIQAESESVAAYYQVFTSKLKVNDQQGFTLCPGASKVVSVDNTSAALYKWYRDGNVIPNQTGPTLTITQEGQYVAQADYGTCSDGTKSNPIVVTMLSAVQKVQIEGERSVQVCQGQGHRLEANLKSSATYYIWYKDNNKVAEGVGQYSYDVPANDIQGSYIVQYGADDECYTRSEPVVLANYQPIDFEIVTESKDTQEYYSGAELSLTIDVTPKIPVQVKWYKDGVLLAETSPTYREKLTTGAVYTAEVSNQTHCPGASVITKTKDFTIKVIEIEKIPNVVLVQSQEILNQTWILPQEYQNSQTHVAIYHSQTGQKVYDGYNYNNDFPQLKNKKENKGRSEVYFYVIKQEGKEPIYGTLTVLN